MKKILHLISSFRDDASYTIKLGHAIVDRLVEANPGAVVEELNLITENYPHLDAPHFQAFLTPTAELTDLDKEATSYSDKAISQLMDADFIVIGSPFYNFGIHSALKAWIDHIARAGVTFRYTANGPEGLVKGKKVYIALASGGVYGDGPAQAYDFNGPYLKAVLGFLGMTDLQIFRAEGLKVPELQEHSLENAIESISL
ncbi:FMN-dependent NADH-azoreductase [Pedobacter sp.]|uniref:FMN-dependent NADH-azoreductase n=1 Tax=Pedobacter sp. TaxID=1411316 RepID=UPI003D7FB548